MNKNLIREINKKISILELVTKCGIDLKKTGKNFMGLCPFHNEKTPSFSVSPEKNIALCMSCLKGGSPLKFYKQFKGISFSEAILELSKDFDIKLSSSFLKLKSVVHPLYMVLEDTNQYYRNSLKSFFRYDIQYNSFNENNSEIYKNFNLKNLFRTNIEHFSLYSYLQERKLNLGLIEEFNIGFTGLYHNSLTKYLLEEKKYDLKQILKSKLVKKKENSDQYYDFFRNRLILPLKDDQGQIVGFVGRLIDSNHQTKEIKYLFNSETIFFKKKNLLYRFFEHYEFIKQKKEIILCEGFFDVIAFFKLNKKNVVATMGTQLTQQQINLFKKNVENVLVAYDGDSSGKEAALKISQILNYNGFIVKILFLNQNMDPDQCINFHIENKLDFDSFLQNNTKDFIFYTIEEKIKILKNKDIKILEQDIFNLLKFHKRKNQEYYQKQIYVKYQIYVDISNYIPSEKIFKGKSYNNIFFNISQKINNSIENNISIHEINIISDIFLNKEYINFIQDDIINYISNPFVIEIIDKIKEYYDIYASEYEIINGINMENFIKNYSFFLNKLDNDFPIYNLLIEIKQSICFKRKKRIENKEDLKIFYYQLKINSILQEIDSIKKERENILKTKKPETSISKEQFKELTQILKLQEKEIEQKKEEIEKIKEEIRIFNTYKYNFH